MRFLGISFPNERSHSPTDVLVPAVTLVQTAEFESFHFQLGVLAFLSLLITTHCKRICLHSPIFTPLQLPLLRDQKSKGIKHAFVHWPRSSELQ